MSADRELLELAARAVGLALSWHDWGDFGLQPMAAKIGEVCAGPATWNPLTDEGDALRLAVRLCFTIDQTAHSVSIYIGKDLIWRELSDGNVMRLELTRRAIVRAAAAIGRALVQKETT